MKDDDDSIQDESNEEFSTPDLKEVLAKLAELAAAQEQGEMLQGLAQALIKPISRPRHYTLQGKILAYSMGIAIDISEEEWKQAEELGMVDKTKNKDGE